MSKDPVSVLLAEDDPDEKDIFTIFLSGREDMVLESFFDSGVGMLQYLESRPPGNRMPDLIFLDHNMPLETGYQVLQKCKLNDRFATIPVVVFSTYVDSVLEKCCLDAGALAVFDKPMTASGYNEMVDKILLQLGRG